jgi:DNA-directed RNA polymerase subunit beta'
MVGRVVAGRIVHPQTGEVLLDRGAIVTVEQAQETVAAGVESVFVRSPLTCELPFGMCAECYGKDLGRGEPVELGATVGIVAAQSIGEPGTQLTLRTFHTGGSPPAATSPPACRAEELFERARSRRARRSRPRSPARSRSSTGFTPRDNAWSR